MPKANSNLGRHGEEVALGLLRKNGYKILARNYKSGLSEIDIIAKDKDTFCFIEVKSRSSDRFGSPEDSILARKQRQIAKSALVYLKENNLLDKKARFDVVCVTYSQNIALKSELIKNAFELDGSFAY